MGNRAQFASLRSGTALRMAGACSRKCSYSERVIAMSTSSSRQ